MPKAKPLRTHKNRAFNPYDNLENHSNVNSETIRGNKLSQYQESVAATDGDREAMGSNSSSCSLSLSKGQKKRLERKKIIMQKIGLVAPDLRSNNRKHPKNKFESLYSELEASMHTHGMVDASDERADADGKISIIPAASSGIKSNKLRKAVAIRETQRMRLVQQDPLFLLDPIAATTQHLLQIASNKQQQQQQQKTQT